MCFLSHVGLSFFFLFKQKTSYEMRISDWSSDVCSSDLPGQGRTWTRWPTGCRRTAGLRFPPLPSFPHLPARRAEPARLLKDRPHRRRRRHLRPPVWRRQGRCSGDQAIRVRKRSEEHTSELQSLMRTSNTVLGLKKKITHNTTA